MNTKSELKVQSNQHYLDSQVMKNQDSQSYLQHNYLDMVNMIVDEETMRFISQNYTKAVEDLTISKFDNSSPIIHLDENGNEHKNSPLENHLNTMAHIITNLSKNK